MNSLRDEDEKLKQILRRAHWEKEKIGVGNLSLESTMFRIRESGAMEPASLFLEIFGPFVWRLAPVACLLIVALIGVLLTLDFASGNDLFQMLMNGREELTLAQIFEI